VRDEPHRFVGCVLVMLGFFQWFGAFGFSQQDPPESSVPSGFNLDMKTAARLRPQLIAESVAPSGRFAIGRAVFDRLVAQLQAGNMRFAWELRLVADDELNAYASPDGTVYVGSGLAQMAGSSTGLWAAILSHEIAHVVRRDWARRYLYQKYLEANGGASIVLGDPGLPSASWSDSEKASQDMGRFCRRMELDADRDGLMLMARAGYHPDFVPALHHLLHAQTAEPRSSSLYAMHPCWEERDQELTRVYEEASSEFARIWTEWYASPGGNPPVLVFAGEPKIRRAGSGELEIQVPLRCQNLAGAVEVVLQGHTAAELRPGRKDADSNSGSSEELRQLTGCTSPRTTVTFTVGDRAARAQIENHRTDLYVLDAWGSVLARADLPAPHR
jgi:hypothetical protein